VVGGGKTQFSGDWNGNIRKYINQSVSGTKRLLGVAIASLVPLLLKLSSDLVQQNFQFSFFVSPLFCFRIGWE